MLSLPLSAQKKWDGGGGDNQWSNALNWSGNTLPDIGDDVLLDNSVVSQGYNVLLPVTAVTVKTVTITPASGENIELTLPVENTLVPGLTIAGPGYGLIINNGGIFRNSSGASSGTPVIISDSIRINNNGRYVHNTPRGHSMNVDRLSAAPGTEKGILEFDIPDPSTTISLSGRIYGRLILSAAAHGAALNYTAAGTNSVLIRDNLELGEGVNFNLNFSDTIFINGDLKQEQGVFNLGNTNRSVVVVVKGNVDQEAEGIITESGAGKPVLSLAGTGQQQINMRGTIENEVSFSINNPGGALLTAALILPYHISFIKGSITTSENNILKLLSGCSVSADTILNNSFINGPVIKEGLDNEDFLFPVGKGQNMRWLALNNATGNFTVEYFHSDPRLISNNVGDGIDHISGIEYWNISGNGSSSGATVKLSFNDPHSGGVTNLSHLRATRLVNGVWEDAGNAGFGGSPGSNELG